MTQIIGVRAGSLIKAMYLAILLFAQGGIQAAISPSWLEQEVQEFVQNKPINAMMVGVWVDGKPVSLMALGETMTEVKASSAMHFRIGGVAETLLTTLLMQFVEDGKISLDSKVARWFPNFPNAEQVTLKMLANGTSGYPDYVYNEKFIQMMKSHPFKHWSDKELLSYALMDKPFFKPGANQRYSHTDYLLLGQILSKVAQQPICEVLQAKILKPLDMNQTAFERTAWMPEPILHAFSQERGVYEDATFWDPSWTSTSGAMYSTLQDLGRWGNAWMKGRLISPEAVQTLRAPDTVGKGKNTAALYFAMGFGVANHWLIQNPSFGGYSGIFAVLPEKNMVFIAFNTVNKQAKSDENWSKALWHALSGKLAPNYQAPTL